MRTPLFRTLLLVLLGIAGAKGALAADVSPLQEIVNEKLALVARWESEARFLVMLGLAGIVLGSLITLLQPWASRLWCKVAAGAFGVAAAVVAFLISHSAVSATSYQKAALQARTDQRSQRRPQFPQIDLRPRHTEGPAGRIHQDRESDQPDSA